MKIEQFHVLRRIVREMVDNVLVYSGSSNGLYSSSAMTDLYGSGFTNDIEKEVQKQKVHIRFQKTGPRSITIVEGLEDDLDIKRIAKAFKKTFSCASSVHIDKLGNEVIKLQGNHLYEVRDWLIEQEIITQKESPERIVIHGL
jgi:translation initiation factor 1